MIVIGLDGAHFELIDPWIEEGWLPNLKYIKENGCWANMRSQLPPVTVPNWKCYSTGMNPGKLNLYYWEHIDWENRKVYLPDLRTDKKEIWDYLSEVSRKVGVMGMPLTYPPKKVNGFMVSGFPDAFDKGYTYPPELETFLKGKYEFINPNVKHSIVTEMFEAASEVLLKIEQGFEAARYLYQDEHPEFFHVTCFYLNELHHYLWDSPITLSGWSITDNFIGDMLEKGKDIIIMSDHGSNKIEKIFNINTWLEKGDYLTLKGPYVALRRRGITKELGARMLRYPSLINFMKRIIPGKIWERIPLEGGAITNIPKQEAVDWNKSWVVASDQGPVYLKDKNNEMLKEELISRLEKLEGVVEKVYRKEEIYWGPYLSNAPDLIIDQQPNVHISSGLGLKNIFDKSGTNWIAENKKDALFMAIGPNIRARGKIEDVSILDLAPTVLNMMGMEVPKDMDGGVLDL